MPRASGRHLDLVVLAAIVVLTLATAYIHYWVGGMMLMLNAIGYVTLAVLVTGWALFYRRALPLLLAALAAYAAVTILGWLVMGPYFDVASIAKGIEIALFALIGVRLWMTRGELRGSIGWGRSRISRYDVVPHNVAIRGGNIALVGEIFSGPAERTYFFAAVPVGSYTFVCDVHPEMKARSSATEQ